MKTIRSHVQVDWKPADPLGPMAQDFRKTFGTGGIDRGIAPVDADGVALISIQALHRRIETMRKESRACRRSSKRLSAELRGLGSRLRTLEQAR